MGQHKFVSDFELEIVANAVLYYLDEFVLRQVNLPKAIDLLEMRTHWQQILVEPINGAIDLNLDAYFAENAQRQFLLELLSFSKTKLTANYRHVSVNILNRIFSYEIDLKQGEISSELVREYFDNIIEFIDGAAV
jgi:hypothetical protein